MSSTFLINTDIKKFFKFGKKKVKHFKNNFKPTNIIKAVIVMIHVGGFPQWNPLVRRFGTESPIFASGNMERESLAKHLAINLTHQKHLNDDVVEDDDDDCNYNANAVRATLHLVVCAP